jgi:hypothetical protein
LGDHIYVRFLRLPDAIETAKSLDERVDIDTGFHEDHGVAGQVCAGSQRMGHSTNPQLFFRSSGRSPAWSYRTLSPKCSRNMSPTHADPGQWNTMVVLFIVSIDDNHSVDLPIPSRARTFFSKPPLCQVFTDLGPNTMVLHHSLDIFYPSNQGLD